MACREGRGHCGGAVESRDVERGEEEQGGKTDRKAAGFAQRCWWRGQEGAVLPGEGKVPKTVMRLLSEQLLGGRRDRAVLHFEAHRGSRALQVRSLPSASSVALQPQNQIP